MTATCCPPREAAEVWCACWERCGGIFVPGYAGAGLPDLCERHERERLAELNRQPEPEEARGRE